MNGTNTLFTSRLTGLALDSKLQRFYNVNMAVRAAMQNDCQGSRISPPSLPRALVHVRSDPVWRTKRHHLGPAFRTELGSSSFIFRHDCLFLGSDGPADNLAQQSGVAAVGDHRDPTSTSFLKMATGLNIGAYNRRTGNGFSWTTNV